MNWQFFGYKEMNLFYSALIGKEIKRIQYQNDLWSMRLLREHRKWNDEKSIIIIIIIIIYFLSECKPTETHACIETS